MRKAAYSSDSLPEKDRVEATSHLLSTPGSKTTIAKRSPDDFRCRMECQGLAGLSSVVMHSSAVVIDYGGGGSLSDHLELGFGIDSGPFTIGYRGVDTTVTGRDAYLRSLELPCAFTSETPLSARSIAIPAQEIFQRLKAKDSAFAPSLRADTPGMSLMRQYLGVLDHGDSLSDPVEQRIFASHVYDLAALVLGAHADAAEQARCGGLRAARLKAAKDYVDAHLFEPDLSDRTVASHLAVSDRYVRMLFSSEGETCKTYIDRQRLAAAHAMLSNSSWAGQKIIDLAFRCGFNDITTFNRQFRARYGMTPSDARNFPLGAVSTTSTAGRQEMDA